jgi:hypothetical protein
MPSQAQFTAEVLRELRNYPRFPRAPRGVHAHRMLDPRSAKRLFKAQEYRALAKNLLQRKKVVAALCPALQSLSNDAFQITMVMTPTLMTLRATGAINIPLSPLYFASIALVIARMGLNSLCGRKKNTRARRNTGSSKQAAKVLKKTR